jgi:hypothetical protein
MVMASGAIGDAVSSNQIRFDHRFESVALFADCRSEGCDPRGPTTKGVNQCRQHSAVEPVESVVVNVENGERRIHRFPRPSGVVNDNELAWGVNGAGEKIEGGAVEAVPGRDRGI